VRNGAVKRERIAGKNLRAYLEVARRLGNSIAENFNRDCTEFWRTVFCEWSV
jgi:hypothetical protein